MMKRKGAQSIADILGDLVARRGFARVRGQHELEAAWQAAAGEPASRYTRVGALRRGVLEILVANSVLLQELAGFHKQKLLVRLREQLDTTQVRELRFRLDGQV